MPPSNKQITKMNELVLYKTNAYNAVVLVENHEIIGVWITPEAEEHFWESFKKNDAHDWDGNGETEFDHEQAELIARTNGEESIIGESFISDDLFLF